MLNGVYDALRDSREARYIFCDVARYGVVEYCRLQSEKSCLSFYSGRSMLSPLFTTPTALPNTACIARFAN